MTNVRSRAVASAALALAVGGTACRRAEPAEDGLVGRYEIHLHGEWMRNVVPGTRIDVKNPPIRVLRVRFDPGHTFTYEWFRGTSATSEGRLSGTWTFAVPQPFVTGRTWMLTPTDWGGDAGFRVIEGPGEGPRRLWWLPVVDVEHGRLERSFWLVTGPPVK